VCENNQYNEYTGYRETTAGEVAGRAEAFGIHTETIGGQDVQLVYTTSLKLVKRPRSGEGPAFLHCNTYRFHGHHVGDIDRSYYRAKTEEEEWKNKRDPVKLFAEWLQRSEMADRKLLDQIENEIETHIKEAVDFALNAPYPELDEVDQHVYA
jgi:pyruvate dehydrogenase E1 component alpha subunit